MPIFFCTKSTGFTLINCSTVCFVVHKPLLCEREVKPWWRMLQERFHHITLIYRKYEGCEPFFAKTSWMWCIGGRNPADFCSFFVCRKVTNRLQPNRKPFGCDWHGVLGFSLGHVWLNMVYAFDYSCFYRGGSLFLMIKYILNSFF